jgi:hypothetical protein
MHLNIVNQFKLPQTLQIYVYTYIYIYIYIYSIYSIYINIYITMQISSTPGKPCRSAKLLPNQADQLEWIEALQINRTRAKTC